MIQGKARIVNKLKDLDTIKMAHSLLSEKYQQYKKIVVEMGDSCIVIDIQKNYIPFIVVKTSSFLV
jgi:hypothetical protein